MADIAARLRMVAPAGVVVAEPSAVPLLWPGEFLTGAVASRLAEFSAGRSAARQAFCALGLPSAAIPKGPDRAPVWPAMVSGSITHCAGACLAVMAMRRDYQSLGVDIEPIKSLPQELWPVILRPEELQDIAALPYAQQGLQALRIFVAKEAAYKAQYAISRQIFDFQTLRITHIDQSITANFCTTIGPFEKDFQIFGRYAETQDFSAAIFWLGAV